MPDLQWEVRRVGPSGVDISRVRIGAPDTPALLMDAVRLDYSPAGLSRRRLDQASITGMEIWCGLENGHFFIRGLDLKALAERFKAAPGPPSPNLPGTETTARPPFLPETIEIRHSLIRFAWGERILLIPVDLRITSPPDRPQHFQAGIEAALFGHNITFDGDLDLQTGRAHWRISTSGFPMGSIAQAAGLSTGTAVSGALDMVADAAFRIDPFVLEAVYVRIDASRYHFESGPIAAHKSDDKPPAALAITLAGDHQWDVSLAAFSLTSPLPVTLSRLDTRLSLADGGVDGRGEAVFVFTPPETDPVDRTGKDDQAAVPAGFSFGLSPSGAWHFVLSSQKHVNPSVLSNVQVDMMKIQTAEPRFTLTGEGRFTGGTVRYTVDTGQIQATAPGIDVRSKSMTLEGDIHFDGPGNARATLELRGEETTISAEKGKDRVEASLPSAAVSGSADFSGQEGLRFDGKADLTDGTLTLPESRVKIGGIRLSLPLAWPWQASRGRGTCSLSSVRWEARDMGSLKGLIHSRPEGLGFDVNFFSRPLPGLVLKITGDSPFLSPGRPSALSWSTRYRPAAPLDMGRFSPEARGMTADGILKVNGRMSIGDDGLAGDMRVALSDGRIEIKDKGLQLDDIRLDLNFPDLPALRSAPEQALSIGRLSMGNIRIEDADIRFQIEPDAAVLVEKSRFKWCGGNVNAQSMRISPKMTDIDLILYCDRLNLAELLDQLGAARAEGEGAVNGRIPIRLRKGKLQFDDGFLYSTPGDGGVIHVTGAQVMTAGIPQNTPQFAQIDLAVEALKSYEYAWAKLRINSEGENLRLNMQFDGKPTAPLPFVYKQEFGGFVRVDASHPGSRFQGIRLDVNLGLPLDKILQYKDLMDMVQ